jgi:L-2-hydroxyglutarate oxidase LhgO
VAAKATAGIYTTPMDTTATLFDRDMIEAVFSCQEMVIDYSTLARLLSMRLASAGVEVRISTEVATLADAKTGIVAGLSGGSKVTAQYEFNTTYSQVNAVLEKANLPRAHLKHELTELAHGTQGNRI